MNNSVKDLQQKTLEILKAFIDVCEQLDLKYYLVEGTLLGAVRHKGFIPWDDDIDVGMLREDYELFLKKAPSLLPKHMFLQTFESDPGYPQTFAKIRNSNTTFFEPTLVHKKTNHGLFLDIFPIDGCNVNFKNSLKFKVTEILCNLRTSYLISKKYLSLAVRVMRPLSMLFYPTVNGALKAKQCLYTATPNEEYVTNYHSLWGDKEIMPKSWYGDGLLLEFEGIKVNCPTEYDKWLTQVYGDYMQLPPEEKRVTHHDAEIIDLEKSYTEYLK